jgi:ATP-dependent RNA helicase RhlE
VKPTFVSPEEEGTKQIERAIGKQLPRVTVSGFDYSARPQAKLEVPLAERIAEIRKKKSEDRARAAAKVARRDAAQGSGGARGGSPARPAAKASPYSESSRRPDRRVGANCSPGRGGPDALKLSGSAWPPPRYPIRGGTTSCRAGGSTAAASICTIAPACSALKRTAAPCSRHSPPRRRRCA